LATLVIFGEEHGLGVSENRVLRRIFPRKEGKTTDSSGELHKEELALPATYYSYQID
jgi:hypothetical protein